MTWLQSWSPLSDTISSLLALRSSSYSTRRFPIPSFCHQQSNHFDQPVHPLTDKIFNHYCSTNTMFAGPQCHPKHHIRATTTMRYISPLTWPMRWYISPLTWPMRWYVSPLTWPMRWYVSPLTWPMRWYVSPWTWPARWYISPLT